MSWRRSGNKGKAVVVEVRERDGELPGGRVLDIEDGQVLLSVVGETAGHMGVF